MPTDMTETSFQRFILAAAFCFAVTFAAIWWWTAEKPMFFLDVEYPMWVAKMQLVAAPATEDLVILGDSRPEADLIPARIGPNVVNLAMAGSTSIESLFFARKVVARTSLPHAVIISFTPDQFMEEEWFWNYTASFGFLTLDDINEVRLRSRTLKDNTLFGPGSPGDFDARFKCLLYATKFPAYTFPALWTARFYKRHAINLDTLAHVLSTRGQMSFGEVLGTTDPDDVTKLTFYRPSKIGDDYFDQTLAVFAAKQIPVYFLAMPYNVASDPLFFHGLKSQFADYLNQYASRYPNFHVLGNLFTIYPSELFGDNDHLNSTGAAKWSDQVAQLLKDNHIAGGPFGPK